MRSLIEEWANGQPTAGLVLADWLDEQEAALKTGELRALIRAGVLDQVTDWLLRSGLIDEDWLRQRPWLSQNSMRVWLRQHGFSVEVQEQRLVVHLERDRLNAQQKAKLRQLFITDTQHQYLCLRVPASKWQELLQQLKDIASAPGVVAF